MKRILILVSVALGLFLAMPAFACDTPGDDGDRAEGESGDFTPLSGEGADGEGATGQDVRPDSGNSGEGVQALDRDG